MKREAETERVQKLSREYWTTIREVKLSDARFYRRNRSESVHESSLC